MKLRSKGNSNCCHCTHKSCNLIQMQSVTAGRQLQNIDLGFANSRSESALRPTILSECAKFTSQGVALSTHRGPGMRFSLVLTSNLRLSVLLEDSPQPSLQHSKVILSIKIHTVFALACRQTEDSKLPTSPHCGVLNNYHYFTEQT